MTIFDYLANNTSVKEVSLRKNLIYKNNYMIINNSIALILSLMNNINSYIFLK